MKNHHFLKTLIVVFVFALTSCNKATEGENLPLTKFKVWGNCEMCKETIEGSLKDQKGIKSADWNVKTKMIEVKYDSATIKVNDIHNKIAAVGYDTELKKGDDKAYNGLPECCQYKRKE